MTTDAAARLAALRERRAGGQGEDQPSGVTRHRRRHAATGARILAGSLSASAALALMAMMAGVGSGARVAESPVSSPPEPVVIVVRSSTGATVAAAPAVAASAAPPVTSSQSS